MKSAEHSEAGRGISPARGLILAGLFGLAFGFLLQKGGVAKYHVLVGVLLFQDFTVIKVMLSAVVVGMFGVFAFQALGWVETKEKSTRLGSNILGGLIFGAGFACSGYCPGTAAAALGQSNGDTLFAIAGMMAGSYGFALASGWLARTVHRWGDRGPLRLPDLVRMRTGPFVLGFGLLLMAGLWWLESVTAR